MDVSISAKEWRRFVLSNWETFFQHKFELWQNIITIAAHYEPICVKSRTCHFESSLLHKNLSLNTVTFGEKVLSLHKSRGVHFEMHLDRQRWLMIKMNIIQEKLLFFIQPVHVHLKTDDLDCLWWSLTFFNVLSIESIQVTINWEIVFWI